MLYDVIWCYMMLYDVIWCYMMLYDVIWCYMMLYDVIWCYMYWIATCYLLYPVLPGKWPEWVAAAQQAFLELDQSSTGSPCGIDVSPVISNLIRPKAVPNNLSKVAVRVWTLWRKWKNVNRIQAEIYTYWCSGPLALWPFGLVVSHTLW